MRHLKHLGFAAALTLPTLAYGQVTPGTSTPGLPQPAPSSAPNVPSVDEEKVPVTQTPLPKPDPKTAKEAKADADAKARAKELSDSMPSPGENLDPHIKPGSEADVNAIGTRSIGGRGMGNWYSTDWEIRVGKQYSQEIEKSAHLVTDPVIVEYVNRVGQNLVKNSDAKVPFTIKVIDSDEINAMALPGGFFLRQLWPDHELRRGSRTRWCHGP